MLGLSDVMPGGDAMDAADREAAEELHAEIRRREVFLQEVQGRLSRSPRSTSSELGSKRGKVNNLLKVAGHCIAQAKSHVDLATKEHSAAIRAKGLELVRESLWVAALTIGLAMALLPAEKRRYRTCSRSGQLARLAQEHPELSVAKLNELLSVPIDHRDARRIVADLRKGGYSEVPRGNSE
jgi:hypothetical protein